MEEKKTVLPHLLTNFLFGLFPLLLLVYLE